MSKKKTKTLTVEKSKEQLANELKVESLLPEINADIRECNKSGSDATKYAIQAGDLLLKLKAVVKHGEWLPLLESRVDCPPRTAQTYMKMSCFVAGIKKEGKDIASDATVGCCLKLIGQSKQAKQKKPNAPTKRISPKPGDAKNEVPGDEEEDKTDDGPLNDEPEEELDFDAQVKKANGQIESFCRQLVEFYEGNCPKLQSIDYQGRFDSAMAHIRAACETLRTCKYSKSPCPKCTGAGCSACEKESDFGGVTVLTYRQLAG